MFNEKCIQRLCPFSITRTNNTLYYAKLHQQTSFTLLEFYKLREICWTLTWMKSTGRTLQLFKWNHSALIFRFMLGLMHTVINNSQRSLNLISLIKFRSKFTFFQAFHKVLCCLFVTQIQYQTTSLEKSHNHDNQQCYRLHSSDPPIHQSPEVNKQINKNIIIKKLWRD